MRPGFKLALLLLTVTAFPALTWLAVDKLSLACRLAWDNERTMGRIVAVDTVTSHWIASVEYRTPRGTFIVPLRGGKRWRAPRVGTEVEVLYDPEAPRVAIAGDLFGALAQGGLILIFGVLAGVGIVAVWRIRTY